MRSARSYTRKCATCRRGRARAVAFRGAGTGAPASADGGDFSTDELPKGDDLISRVRVLHDHDDDLAMRLLAAIWAALSSEAC